MPQRSRGCNTCRRRKVRCDLTRPLCRNCTDRSMECLGYRPEVDPPGYRFQDQTERTIARVTGSLSYSQQMDISSPSVQQMSPQLEQRQNQEVAVVDPRPLMETQLLATFFDVAFPSGRQTYVPAQYAWLQHIQAMNPREEALPFAMTALSNVYLGTTFKERRLLHASRNHYAAALRKLSAAIARPQIDTYEETFAAIMALTLCELFSGLAENDAGWRSHVGGASTFLQTHGPSTATNSNLSRKLLHNARLSIAYLGELDCEAVFLDSPTWLNATTQSTDLDSTTALLNIRVQVPALISHCLSTPNHKEPLHQANHLQNQLSSWFSTHLANTGFAWATTTNLPSSLLDFRLNKAFDIAFSFPDLRTGCLHLTYWTTRLRIAKAVNDMFRRHQTPSSTPSTALTEPAQEAEAEVLQSATKICQCIPYCCQPTAGPLPRICSLLSLVVAFEAFEALGYVEQTGWCRLAFGKLRGYGIVQPGLFPSETMGWEEREGERESGSGSQEESF